MKRLDSMVLRVKQEAEDVTNQRMRTLCEVDMLVLTLFAEARGAAQEHERQVAELQRLLNNESERLTLAREEICDLSMSKVFLFVFNQELWGQGVWMVFVGQGPSDTLLKRERT